jgi:hypothetical protein
MFMLSLPSQQARSLCNDKIRSRLPKNRGAALLEDINSFAGGRATSNTRMTKQIERNAKRPQRSPEPLDKYKK